MWVCKGEFLPIPTGLLNIRKSVIITGGIYELSIKSFGLKELNPLTPPKKISQLSDL
jgi:hypothetical protein